jgi:hypothetical protein
VVLGGTAIERSLSSLEVLDRCPDVGDRGIIGPAACFVQHACRDVDADDFSGAAQPSRTRKIAKAASEIEHA